MQKNILVIKVAVKIEIVLQDMIYCRPESVGGRVQRQIIFFQSHYIMSPSFFIFSSGGSNISNFPPIRGPGALQLPITLSVLAPFQKSQISVLKLPHFTQV